MNNRKMGKARTRHFKLDLERYRSNSEQNHDDPARGRDSESVHILIILVQTSFPTIYLNYLRDGHQTQSRGQLSNYGGCAPAAHAARSVMGEGLGRS